MSIDVLMIIFRLMLFGLLIYKVMQLINAYAIPFLKEELDLEHKQQTELLEKEKLLISTQHRLENQINQQKKTFTLLDKNVLCWQTHLLKQKEESEHNAQLIRITVEQKRKMQYHYLVRAKNSHIVVPAACEQAAAELQQNLTGDTGAQQLQSLIDKLVQHNAS